VSNNEGEENRRKFRAAQKDIGFFLTDQNPEVTGF
jgi:hypothetical protein